MSAAAAACGGGAEGDELDPRARCAELRDHLVELDTAGVTKDRAAHRAALAAALGDEFVDRCATEPAAHLACGLRATTLDEAARCEVSP